MADLTTPVSMYMKIRDRFPGSCLLESSDYRGTENSFSYICFDPISSIKVENGYLQIRYPDGEEVQHRIKRKSEVIETLQKYLENFVVERDPELPLFNGLAGYCSYDAVQYFEDLELKVSRDPGREIPELNYILFRYVIAVNHNKSEMYLLKNSVHGLEDMNPASSMEELEKLQVLLQHKDVAEFSFEALGEEYSNFTDQEHIQVIEACKKHIMRGDVFQIVPSRRFSQRYKGDDFKVYRALRSINPSPYLFYFDFGNFKIFGSSPEAQLLVKNQVATIHPIAGTCPRTGNESVDHAKAQKLLEDPKENAEHVMLVDLARNDLSRHCRDVKVQSYREVQFYSHVTHLVSKVVGTLKTGQSSVALLGATFPAGTVSGAPKYKAMQLIDSLERGQRAHYAGGIGLIDFNGDLIHAIMIRSFLSKDNILHRQAGGGIVADSVPESEVQEVKNKLGALRQAIRQAAEA